MAKVFLNRLYIITVLQRGNGKAVPKVVEPHLGDADVVSYAFELLVYRLVEDVPSKFVGKDEIIGVVLELTGFYLHLQLMLAVLFQHVHNIFGRVKRSIFVVLQWLKRVLPV